MKDGKRLVDECYVCPRCVDFDYFPWIEKLIKERQVDYVFVQPEAEIVEWGKYYEKKESSLVPHLWDADCFQNL